MQDYPKLDFSTVNIPFSFHYLELFLIKGLSTLLIPPLGGRNRCLMLSI